MNGKTSQAAYDAVLQQFEAQLIDRKDEAKLIGDELFEVGKLLDDNARLERALTDPSRNEEDKRTLITSVIGNVVDPLTLSIAQALVAQHWGHPRDLADAMEDMAVEALMISADNRDASAQISFELSALHSALLKLPIVRQHLSDTNATARQRVAFLHALLEGKNLDPVTMDLASHAARDLRNRRYLSTINWLISQISTHRGRSMVTVTSAVELSDEQIVRIKDAYRRKLGRNVYVNCVVDPRVMGGMRIQVGSEVTDNTVIAQLQHLQRAMKQ